MTRSARIAGVLLVLSVLAGACGDDSTGTTTTAQSATTSTSTTTTTTLPAEIEIPETGILKFRPGTTYTASAFWESVSFITEDDGWWWARGATDLWVHVEYHQGGESAFDLDVSVVAQSPDIPVEAVVEDIVRLLAAAPDFPVLDAGRVITEPSATAVDGFDAVVLDVVAPSVAEGGFLPGSLGLSGYSRFAELDLGVMFLEAENPSSLGTTSGSQWSFGVRQGSIARIWVVDVDGSTITIIAAARNQELFDVLIPAAEALIAGIEFRRP